MRVRLGKVLLKIVDFRSFTGVIVIHITVTPMDCGFSSVTTNVAPLIVLALVSDPTKHAGSNIIPRFLDYSLLSTDFPIIHSFSDFD